MGKLRLNNFRDATELTLNQFGGSVYLYVDAVNGNDNNDGLTEATAWKTIAKFNDFIVKKTFSSINLHLIGDSFDEGVDVPHSAHIGTFGLFGTPVSPDVTSTTILYLSCRDTNYVAVNNISVNSDRETLVYMFNSSVLWDGGTVEYAADGQIVENNGMVIINGSLNVTSLTVKNTAYGIVLRNSTGNLAHAVFENAGKIASIGSMISLGSNYGSSEFTLIEDHVDGSGLFNEYILDGIIVESGENENGKYIKYADGTVIIKTPTIKATYVNEVHLVGDFILPIALIDRAYSIATAVSLYGPNTEDELSPIDHTNIRTSLVTSRATSSTACAVYGTFVETDFIYVSAIIIGRWK